LGVTTKQQAINPRHKQQTRLFMLCLCCAFSVLPFSVTKAIAQPTPVNSNNRPILRTGSKGAAVSELQAVLQLLGYYTGSVDGVYGESTAKAVTQFQEAAGIPADGIVGPGTWQRLFPGMATPNSTASTATAARPSPSPSPNSTATAADSSTSSPTATSNANNNSQQPAIADLPILRLGANGPAVFWLQTRLQTGGFFKGTIDGVFGAETETAVKAAQQNYGIEPDGIVGNATWRAILR
jgi:N-acetylmuramoyl-L-alanine amidase